MFRQIAFSSLTVSVLACASACASGDPDSSSDPDVTDSEQEPSGPQASSGEIHVLNYNVAGFPSAIKPVDAETRIPQIAPLLPDFDIAGLQEIWSHDFYDMLAEGSGAETQLRFDETFEKNPTGSGLATFTSLELVEYHHEHFGTCYGVLDHASDCLASKGFQMLRVRLADGAELDFYNTHLEAGRSEEDLAARDVHVDKLVESINTRSADRAVLLVGDMNLHDDPDNAQFVQLTRLLEGAKLDDSCDNVDCDEPGHIERLLTRNGGGVTIESISWANDAKFYDDDGAQLSDHPAISARFAWSFEPVE